MRQKTNTHQLLTLANHYPSPHNGQPIRLHPTEKGFDLFFEKSRGLQGAKDSLLFSFVSMGVFVEHFRLAAQALGHRVEVTVALPQTETLAGSGLVQFASAKMDWDAATPDAALHSTLERRQTSRKKYTEGPDPEIVQLLTNTFAVAGMDLRQLSKEQSQEVIWLNQRAVFDDLFDEPVRKELDHWLRYNKKQKETYRDGLSYDAMEINGAALKSVVRHPAVLRLPGISSLLKTYYTRTMRDKSSVLYVQSAFRTESDAYAIGIQIMRSWVQIAEKGYYLHPFGTIMSNHQAHADFLNIAGIGDETLDSYLVFIFRLGKSDPPVRSLRIPYEKHLLLNEEHA